MTVLDNQLHLVTSYVVPNASAIYLETSAFTRKNLVLAALGTTGIYGQATSPQAQVIDPLTGTLIWTSPAMLGTFTRNSLSFKDVNADGHLEMVFGTAWGMFVTQ
jgi:hypothetical protein